MGRSTPSFRHWSTTSAARSGGVVRGVLQQRFAARVATLVQTEQNAHGELHGRRPYAELGSAFEVVTEGIQFLVEDLVGGLARMDGSRDERDRSQPAYSGGRSSSLR
jgi:hypothetical protein